MYLSSLICCLSIIFPIKTSVDVVILHPSIEVGSTFGGGLGPPNPIHKETANPDTSPKTAPCELYLMIYVQNKIKSLGVCYKR